MARKRTVVGILTAFALVVGVMGTLGVAALLGAPSARAVTLTQAEAPFVAQTADPHAGGGGGSVVDADTTSGPTESSGPNPVILLIAALGVLIGVLVVTRPKRPGPD